VTFRRSLSESYHDPVNIWSQQKLEFLIICSENTVLEMYGAGNYLLLHTVDIRFVGLHKCNIGFLCCRKVHGHKNASYEKLRDHVSGIHWAVFATHQLVSTNRPRLA
jgi:hypothetical protein